MKTSKGIVLFCAVLIILISSACREIKMVLSPEMTEEATVADLVYTPSNHGSDISPTMNMNGDLGVAFTSIDILERYAVVFQCQHEKFIVQSDQTKAKELWTRLKKDQKVTVRYRERYEETFDDEKLVERRLKKYDFIDAN